MRYEARQIEIGFEIHRGFDLALPFVYELRSFSSYNQRTYGENEGAIRASEVHAIPHARASALPTLGSKLCHLLPIAGTIAEGSLESRRLYLLNAETLNK